MFVVVLNKTFRWFSTFAWKSEHIKLLQDFIAWPKFLETGTTKTEKSRDRIGQTEKSRTLFIYCDEVDPKSTYDSI